MAVCPNCGVEVLVGDPGQGGEEGDPDGQGEAGETAGDGA